MGSRIEKSSCVGRVCRMSGAIDERGAMRKRELYGQRARLGLCTHCGRPNPDAPARRQCPDCRAAANRSCMRHAVAARERAAQRVARAAAETLKAVEAARARGCEKCVWGTVLGNVLYCPFAPGTCARERT